MKVSINNSIMMKKEDYYKEQEVSYFAWIVAYELLGTIDLKGRTDCDGLYDFANNIADKFVNDSIEYLDLKHNSYEMFYSYIYNRGGLQKMFDYYFEKERISYDK